MRPIARFVVAAMLFVSFPAAAQWHRVKTDHFELTIDAPAAQARAFASRLEAFDSALRRLYGVADSPDHRARPLKVFALKPDLFLDVCECRTAVGYYRPLTDESVIFSAHMPKIDEEAEVGGWSSQSVLLHEYAHHFASAYFPMALPYWYSEGFAEFNAQASFEPDGSIIIGYPANYRARSLRSDRNLTPKQLFEPERYGYGEGIDLIYARGWLLTHYLMLHPARKGQLNRYLQLVNSGVGSADAAERAFGNLRRLLKEAQTYSRDPLAAPLRIPASTGARIALTPLTQAQAEMFPTYAAVVSGGDRSRRSGLARRAAKIAARYPSDALVQVQAAKAAYAADRFEQADAAAARALALDPGAIDAMVIRGLVALERGADEEEPEPAAFDVGRRWLLKANKADPNAVLPLYFYHRTFLKAGLRAPADAVKGLLRAAVLAPESAKVRGAVARQRLVDNKIDAARSVLAPLAYAPHSRDDNKAREILELLDAGKIAEAKAAIIEYDNGD